MNAKDTLCELKRLGLIESTTCNIPDSRSVDAYHMVKTIKGEFPQVTITEVLYDSETKKISLGFRCPENMVDILKRKISALRNG